MTSLGRYHLIDRPTAVGVTGAWMKGPAISAADLKGSRGGIEHISSATFFGAKETAPSPQRGSAAPPAAGATMWFGKHKGRLLVDLREEEPGYWKWACAEVSGFEAKVRKLGLLDEDAGMDEQDDVDPDDPYTNGSWVPNR